MDMNKDQLKEFYNSHEGYVKRRVDSEYRNDYLDEIDLWKNKYLYEVLPKDITINRILEIGCGTGDLLARFPFETPLSERVGIDISEKNIDSAKKRYPEISWYCGSIMDISFNHKFDLVILSDILEHVENDFELLKKASDHSKILLVNIPMEKCYMNRKAEYGLNVLSGHLRAYDYRDVLQLTKRADLTITSSLIKYVIKEPFWQKRYSRNYFTKFDFNQTLIRIPFYIYRVIKFKFLYKLYTSNFFGTLKKM
jgi:2-polyprenyl-3-methyl-5-hydroxy-6-metoxy-1,4-benzoquinol methylase